MKMFRTSNADIGRNCQSYFSFNFPSELWSNRVKRFDVKYATSDGSFSLMVPSTNVGQIVDIEFCSVLLYVSSISYMLMLTVFLKAVATIFVREGFYFPFTSSFSSPLPCLPFPFLPLHFSFLALFLLSLPQSFPLLKSS